MFKTILKKDGIFGNKIVLEYIKAVVEKLRMNNAAAIDTSRY